jgi:hypothetical protein
MPAIYAYSECARLLGNESLPRSGELSELGGLGGLYELAE